MKAQNLLFILVGLLLFHCKSKPTLDGNDQLTLKGGMIADFETENLADWESSGDLTPLTTKKQELPQNISGFVGSNVYSTGHNHPERTGTITSPAFKVNKKYINFLITGNHHYNAEIDCHVRVIIDGMVARYAPATRYPLVEWGSIDVSEFKGQNARFEIFDESKKHFIVIDQIYQSDELALGINQLTVQADKNYLLFPVTKGGTQYRFRLEKEGDVTEQFVVEMSDEEPDYWAFKDLSHYQGKEITLTSYCPTTAEGFNKIILSDEVPGEEKFYSETERPQFHFTSKTGWLNDPNGLVYHNGIWHMMYQHNPYGIIGSLKHWGHATSTDLIHWTEKPSSVVPDDLGSNHSGGAVVDFNNSAGLQTGQHKTLLAFWTSAGHFTTPSSRFRQCISYSTDDGITWKKYADNPIIGFIDGRNRDPNVIWHPEAEKWIMSLYINGNEYAIFNSENLIDWELTDRITMPASECPDMFQLNLDGNPDKRKWIFWGGNGSYVVGGFDGRKFSIEGEAHRTHFGNYYAAMTYNNAPDGRVVQVGWLRGKWPFHNANFNQQMSISNEITLKTSPAGYPALYSYPVKALEVLRTASFKQKNVTIGKQGFSPDFKTELIDMNVVAKVKKGGVFRLNIRGEELIYNRDDNTISYGKASVELVTQGDIQEFRILVDRASIEVFCNKGEKAMFFTAAIDADNQTIEFSANHISAEIQQLEIYSLKSGWKK